MTVLENKCQNCGRENNNTLYFCEYCGKFIRKNELKHPEIASRAEYKLLRIMDNIQNVPHNPIIWNDVIDQYTKKVEVLKALYNIDDLHNQEVTGITEKMIDFLNICSNSVFQIAFVGTVKTGKSTLINALLGKNYASTSVTPETAVLTKFRASARDYIKVQFYTKAEWDKLWKSRTSAAGNFMREYNALKADTIKGKYIGKETLFKELANNEIETELSIWSSSQHAEHYFVKEIEVGISSLPSSFPKQVVFVDTPGLSDPVVYRSDITKEYIRKANAVFVCVDSTKIYKEETETIASVFAISSHNKSKVHIVATHWDCLNNPLVDWERQMSYFTQTFVGDAFYDTAVIAKKNILYSSAYIYNLLQQDFNSLPDIEGDNVISFGKKLGLLGRYFSEDELFDSLNNIKEKTNITSVLEIIRDRLIKNYKTILSEDIGIQFVDVCKGIRRVGTENINELKGFINATDLSLADKKKKVEEQKKIYSTVVTNKQQLEGMVDMVHKRTQERISSILQEIDENIKQGLRKKNAAK